jgi:hypothetical protein
MYETVEIKSYSKKSGRCFLNEFFDNPIVERCRDRFFNELVVGKECLPPWKA